ncbi:hypothetical protein Tsubulata_018151 [Turnera subulata]|uniref:Ubiquitin carboxyl-terminal hydrolase n=1 Tax=Turnera subulata TaxID=218843 RepID=A0A9Q0G0H3_9ROSI|nr:hypothetical protein Tsubulata_018151 [Turnera subulata]
MENVTVQPAAENGAAAAAASSSSSSGVVTVDSLFPRKIQFQLSTKQYAVARNGAGDFRIETLNPDPSRKRAFPGSDLPKRPDGSDFVENGLDPELTFGITFRRIGAGLENLGNTCFLNSVLQCLTYTEPLAAYLQSGKHQNSCHIAGFCALCAIQKHVSRALQSTGRSLVPKDLVSNLRCILLISFVLTIVTFLLMSVSAFLDHSLGISRNFRNARQEDAHEYMVNLLESMHKCCLPSGVPIESPAAYEKSLVHKIFGGRLRSQVECQQCRYCSNKFDPFLDLSLDIFRVDTLRAALQNFTAAEMLDGGERQYQCQRCKQKVKAKKRLTVHKAPYVLTVHLKRFHAHDPGRKVDKKVIFDRTLDMKPFVSGSYEGELKYSLYGVLVHYGHNTHSGHYVCFVRTSSGMWYLLNDNQVRQVSEKQVLEQKAYMLFYVRDRKNTAPRKSVDVVQKENTKAMVSNNIANVAGKQFSSGSIANSSSIQYSVTAIQKDATTIVSPMDAVTTVNQKDAGTAVKQKDAATIVNQKEIPLKDTALQQNNVMSLPGCLVPKVEPPVDNSVKVPLLKDPIKEQTLPSKHVGEGLQPPAPLNSQNDCFKLERASGSKTSCNGTRSPAIPATSQIVDPVSNIRASAEVLSKDCIDRVPKDVPRPDISLVSDEKTPSHTVPVNSPSKTSCENCQAGCIHNETAAGSSLTDDGCRIIVHDSADFSVSSLLPNEFQKEARVRKHHKKLKCKLLKSWLFRASIILRKKKKHRKSRRHSLETQNLIKEQLLDNDYLSIELGPSTSEKPSSTCSLNLQSMDAKSGHESGDSVRKSSREFLVDAVHAEFKERNNKNGSVLATSEQLLKSSVPINEEKKTRTEEPKCFENHERNALQIGTASIRACGLEETTVARWDGIDLPPPQSRGVHHEETVSIGYMPDEWDEEYDKGKRKKLRQNKLDFGGSNPFQEIASKKTQFKKAKMDRSSSGNQPFRI